jgi:hypothetical protein
METQHPPQNCPRCWPASRNGLFSGRGSGPVRSGQGQVDRIPGFRRTGVRAFVAIPSAGAAGGLWARFSARGRGAADKANPAAAGYRVGDRRDATLYAGSSEAAIGTNVSDIALRSIASPAFARRMVVIIMIAMLGCGLMLGLTHAVPWKSANTADAAMQAPVDDGPPIETQVSVPRDDRAADVMPPASPAGVVAPLASVAQPVPSAAQPIPSSLASLPAVPDLPAQDQSSGVALNAPGDGPTEEATAQFPVPDRQAPTADKKPVSKKTSAPKVAAKKPAAKRAASQDPAMAEAPAPIPAVDITTPR